MAVCRGIRTDLAGLFGWGMDRRNNVSHENGACCHAGIAFGLVAIAMLDGKVPLQFVDDGITGSKAQGIDDTKKQGVRCWSMSLRK